MPWLIKTCNDGTLATTFLCRAHADELLDAPNDEPGSTAWQEEGLNLDEALFVCEHPECDTEHPEHPTTTDWEDRWLHQ